MYMLRSTSLNLCFLGNKCLEIRIRLDIYWEKYIFKHLKCIRISKHVFPKKHVLISIPRSGIHVICIHFLKYMFGNKSFKINVNKKLENVTVLRQANKKT